MSATTDRPTHIVPGGGSAGCALASRLSGNPDNRVLLIEAGPDYGTTIGVRNPHVPKASIMPRVTRANTSPPSIMIGERVAALVQRRL